MRTTTNDIDIPDQTGTLAVVTGANGGIGFGVSQRLAAAGALVILAVRNTDKGNQAAQAIRAASPHAQVVVEQLDLASLASVEAFAARLLIRDPPINTLARLYPYYAAKASVSVSRSNNARGICTISGCAGDIQESVTGQSRLRTNASVSANVGRALGYQAV